MKNFIQNRILAARPPAGYLLTRIVLASLLAVPSAHAGVQFQRLKSFGDPGLAGQYPSGGLIEGSDGKIYGTTVGSSLGPGAGLVFKFNKDGTGFVPLRFFDSSATDGAHLFAGVVEGSDGALYGTTTFGGSNDAGTLYKLNKDGTGYAILHHFGSNDSDGRSPYVRLLEGSDGKLYGTTVFGGTHTNQFGDTMGTVFRLNKNGTGYTILHEFGSIASDGDFPLTQLMEGSDGALYGTTCSGGANNAGTVFQLNKDGNGYRIVRNFGSSGSDGRDPRPLVEGGDGMLYGTTYSGGTSNLGTVFRMGKDGSGYSVLRHFGGYFGNDGANPASRLLGGSDGALYGTTEVGGTNATGTVFKMNKDGSGYSVLRHLNAAEGWRLEGALLEGRDGALYGNSFYGGWEELGTLFKLDKDGSNFSVLRSFVSIPSGGDGANPAGRLVESTDGRLYGTAFGGSNNAGVVISLNKDGSGYHIVHHFKSDGSGEAPQGLIERSDGKLYGTTVGGGSEGWGTVFKLNRDGTGYTILHHFANGPTDGAIPTAELLAASNGSLYGTTAFGGASTNEFGVGRGTLFKLNPDGSGYSILRHFGSSSTDGRNPQGNLLEGSDGVLYGTTVSGGNLDNGTVFRVNKDGSGYAILRHFVGNSLNDGLSPLAGVIEGSDGALYGPTFGGGSNGVFGTVFKLTKNGSSYGVLHHFSGAPSDGDGPISGLVEGLDGALYGITQYGGSDSLGTVFRLNKDGSGYALLRSFGSSAVDGRVPAGLVKDTNGSFFGVTYDGGDAGLGTIFKLSFSVAITRTARNGNLTVLDVAGVPYSALRIQARTNLIASEDAWVNIATNVAGASGLFQLTYPEPPTRPARFYRAVWP